MWTVHHGLDLELAHTDLISQCDANLTLLEDMSSDSSVEELLSSCDDAILDIKNYCNQNPGLTNCSDARIEGYLSARGK
jgi:hypothetical protein